MLDVHRHAARRDLRIGEHLRVVVDRAARDPVGVEELEPVLPRLFERHGLDRGRELRLVPDARGVVGVVGIVRPFGPIQQLAQPTGTIDRSRPPA